MLYKCTSFGGIWTWLEISTLTFSTQTYVPKQCMRMIVQLHSLWNQIFFQTLSSVFHIWYISWYTGSSLQTCSRPGGPATSLPSLRRLDENALLAPPCNLHGSLEISLNATRDYAYLLTCVHRESAISARVPLKRILTLHFGHCPQPLWQ